MTTKHSFVFGLTILGFTLVLSTSALAQFDGDYAIANWTEIREGTPPAGGGEIDTSGAPASILLQGGDDGCDDGGVPESDASGRGAVILGGPPSVSCLLLFLVEITASGTLSFQWDYETEDVDGPEYDVFGYVLNGLQTQLSDDEGGDIQSGTASLSVSEGDEFGFYMDCTDCQEGPASIIISQFSAPSGTTPPPPPAIAVPANSPSALILLALLLAGLALVFIRSGQ
ncbi:MAG: hypothetical protein JJU31_10550 [Wenzhouxiangella sp.]|nr:hypothetical protein [Wenzhouxiangella sp.]MCH8478766.1 hypothetical protein [Wenzhouxiangella sp.]TVR97192.1 MAG: hypothetical protein EA418_03945 [Wenzhouxiangellaceae bacterium]